jgi:hypothetical protein
MHSSGSIAGGGAVGGVATVGGSALTGGGAGSGGDCGLGVLTGSATRELHAPASTWRQISNPNTANAFGDA